MDSHHESWNNRLLELGFKSVHQLFGFGVVERQHTWRKSSQSYSHDSVLYSFTRAFASVQQVDKNNEKDTGYN